MAPVNQPVRLWSPNIFGYSQMTRYVHYLQSQYGVNSSDISEYALLHKWSIDNLEIFWQSVWDYCDIIASSFPTILERHIPMEEIPRWFVGAQLNLAENLISKG